VIFASRRYRFAAAHVLASPALGLAENQRIYGKCANPNGHGHDYGVEITVAGSIDPVTGFLLAPDVLDALVQQHVLDRFDHRLLNEDPLFSDRVPTAENIAMAVHAELAAPIAGAGPARLVRVRVVETPRNTFDYGELA
jgi:6-pyruvoyltetrahydropterin/6-carboxytetrahydropterin synthase